MISREAVLKLVENKPYDWSNLTERHEMMQRIRKLPSVQPSRKGHWIRKEDDMCWWDECSECGLKPLKGRFTNDDILSNFCPSCGADMRGDTDADKERM